MKQRRTSAAAEGRGSPPKDADERVVDDRGRPFTLADLPSRQVLLRSLGIRTLISDPVVRAEGDLTVWLETVVATAGAVVGLVVYNHAIGPRLNMLGGGPWVAVGFILVPVIFAMVAWWACLRTVRTRRGDRIARLYLEHGQCPGCGYELAALPRQQDGCVVCPECDAAWRADRVGTRGPA